MPTGLERPPREACPACGQLVEPRTVVAFDPRLRAVTIERTRCWGCGWERTRGPERRTSADDQ